MKKVIAITVSAILLLSVGISLFIYTRPVDWDAGACGGGYATYIFNKYNEELTQRFLNGMGKDKENVISIEEIEGSHSAQWEEDKIFIQYDVKYEHKDKGIITETIYFTGKRLWIDTFRWSGATVNVENQTEKTIKETSANSVVNIPDKELLLLSEDNMQIKLNTDMSTISKEPISKNEGQGDGFHWKEYSYGDILVKALVGDNNSTNIIYVSTTSNKYKTPRDIKVGDTLQKLKEKYPEDLNKTLSDQICYEYAPQSIGFNRMYFYIDDDTITKIVLENGIDG